MAYEYEKDRDVKDSKQDPKAQERASKLEALRVKANKSAADKAEYEAALELEKQNKLGVYRVTYRVPGSASGENQFAHVVCAAHGLDMLDIVQCEFPDAEIVSSHLVAPDVIVRSDKPNKSKTPAQKAKEAEDAKKAEAAGRRGDAPAGEAEDAKQARLAQEREAERQRQARG